MSENRLEKAGFIAHRAAQELRELLLREPRDEDEIGRRLQQLERDAAALAGVIAAKLRDEDAFGRTA